ncbi:alpha/beta hydrolase [Demequina zhanjiangensis]|uniref:Alpha/beta hydrolase n=1 Tax=Demequina zhanjiangensis TaxID=3051659 RepID=A0ABT8FZ37_9MICO|nr:alpha/beta hydrolase [Demequina sp. SYSU T00b26]MDN4472148.1 alpha/beta hydrolase [Demequina sp. SYSU T00b26]
MTAENLQLTTEWDKTFPQSDKVDHQKVTFTNRYGITLAGDMYTPKGATGQLAAIALAGPFGAVKEQSSGLYAQTLAERGFLTLVFDPSFVGESGGLPRSVASPDINTEDFQAAVDMLSVQDNVDAERIGILGVCGFGGMAISATAIDPRIKATVTSTMYDMTRVNAEGYFQSENSEEQRHEKRATMAAQRTEDFKNGEPKLVGGLPAEAPEGAPQFLVDYVDYYKTDRGYHSRSVNSNDGWTVTTPESFLNMPLNQYAGEIRQPVMLVHGDAAHSYYFSKDAFESMAGDNKELVTIEGASHTDLYDQVDVIPFDKIEAFFNANL